MAGVGETTEQRRMACEFLEVNRGRFSYEEALRLLLHHDWNIGAAVTFVWNETDHARIREIAGGGTNWRQIQGDHVLRELASSRQISAENRQFGCAPCDVMWWRQVPIRKRVSTCKRCRVRYQPVPRDREWGWAEFNCGYCDRVFWGFGQMQTASPCFQCRNICHPNKIIPPARRERRTRRGRYRHSCCAENCFNRANGPITPGVKCVHPLSLERKVLYPSLPHTSTGSTVDTFLPQDHLANFEFDDVETLEVIYERS